MFGVWFVLFLCAGLILVGGLLIVTGYVLLGVYYCCLLIGVRCWLLISKGCLLFGACFVLPVARCLLFVVC